MYKWISSLGIGAATVHTHIERERYMAGEQVTGKIEIHGGLANQTFEQTELQLFIAYGEEGVSKHHLYKAKQYPVSGRLDVQAREIKTIPFSVPLPEDLPMSTGHFPIYIKTVLDAKLAVDPTDTDKIVILPVKLIQSLLKVIEDADFILYKIENLSLPTKPKNGYPFIQIFEFRPTGSNHDVIDEFSVVFTYCAASFRMQMELVRSMQVLQSTFEWYHHDPEGTFCVNGTPTAENPFEKLQSLLKKR